MKRITCRFKDAIALRDVDRAKLDDLLRTLANVEAEVRTFIHGIQDQFHVHSQTNTLRRKIEYVEGNVAALKKEHHHIIEQLQRTNIVRSLP